MTSLEVSKSKTIKEEFAKFYEDPSREALRELLKNHLGEFPELDFKEDWQIFSKIARHILGIANADGGCIVIGVAEKEDKTLEIKGMKELQDKATVVKGIEKFLPSVLLDKVDLLNFTYEASEYPKLQGKKFQVIIITPDPKHLPFVSVADGEGIQKDKIYVRRGTSTVEANYNELQKLINKRLETGYSSSNEIDLRTHLEELKFLYGLLKPYDTVAIESPLLNLQKSMDSLFGVQHKSVRNPHYPKESYDAFIVRMIDKKKKRIEILLDVANL